MIIICNRDLQQTVNYSENGIPPETLGSANGETLGIETDGEFREGLTDVQPVLCDCVSLLDCLEFYVGPVESGSEVWVRGIVGALLLSAYNWHC